MEHAHWDYERLDEYVEFKTTCSNCGWDFSALDFQLDRANFNYCPNCGAKMDEKVE